jgi:hypothetical protein
MGDRILQELQYDTDHTANAALDGAASDQAETSLADDFHRIYTSPPARRS